MFKRLSLLLLTFVMIMPASAQAGSALPLLELLALEPVMNE